jgi:tetratricopeptide (TPR) repeat protein
MPSSSVVVETPTPRETAEAFYAKGLIEYKNLNCIAANEYYRFAIDTLFKTGHTAETEYLAELTSYRWALGLSIYRHANSLYKEKEFAIASDFYALAVNELRLFFNKLANKENFWYEEYHFAAILNMYAKAHCSLGKFEQALDVTWEALEIINEIIRGSTKLFKISNKDIEKVIQLRKHMEGNLFEIIAWMKNNSQIKILHPQKL